MTQWCQTNGDITDMTDHLHSEPRTPHTTPFAGIFRVRSAAQCDALQGES